MEMQEVTIAGKTFNLRSPFEAGHVLTEGEAQQLNQTRRENVRNNMAKTVKEWEGSFEDLVAKVEAYDAEYTMEVRAAGEARTPSDPVTTEAKALARLAIKGALEKANQKADAKAINAAIDQLLAHPEKGPKFRQVAEERVAERKRLAEQAMEQIDLSTVAAPTTAPAEAQGV